MEEFCYQETPLTKWGYFLCFTDLGVFLNHISPSSRGKKVLEANAIEKLGYSFWGIIVLCGDGRNDSPGHSAKYCMYTLVKQFLDVAVEVDDKRETGEFQPI